MDQYHKLIQYQITSVDNQQHAFSHHVLSKITQEYNQPMFQFLYLGQHHYNNFFLRRIHLQYSQLKHYILNVWYQAQPQLIFKLQIQQISLLTQDLALLQSFHYLQHHIFTVLTKTQDLYL